MPTYVLDQNQIRRVPPSMLADKSNSFVVPDVSFIEMVQSDQWRDTMLSSLSPLCPASKRVFMSAAVGELLAIELLERRQVLSGELSPQASTAFLRDLLSSLNREGIAAFDRWQDRIHEARQELLAAELDPTSAKLRLQGLVEPWLNALSSADVNELRRNPDLLQTLTERQARNLSLHLLVQMEGWSNAGAEIFLDGWPVVARYMFVMLRHALRWRVLGGLENANANSVRNHVFDQDYAVIASFFDEFLTTDNEARAAYHALRLAMQPPRTA